MKMPPDPFTLAVFLTVNDIDVALSRNPKFTKACHAKLVAAGWKRVRMAGVWHWTKATDAAVAAAILRLEEL